MEAEIFVHSPTDYVKNNFKSFLPDWESPPVSVIIVLQRSQVALINQGADIEAEKDFLRQKFLDFSYALCRSLDEQRFLTDIIDPRSGYALFSRQGSQSHDDCQVIHQLRQIPIIKQNLCKSLDHPSWGTAVYPGVLMSLAPASKIQPLIVDNTGAQKGNYIDGLQFRPNQA
ncbi:methylmalonic aciduria and homocystinuria type D protein [Gloeothece verrucosa]|uniref:Uncharacterized protein n=1 Tax=Gloeothece verrucosa (strain PCC 7822) TaxID=497965 RepID=E0ULE0_GLOV7|nr:methylmalonic aciduria and homocystinuria type D protein [Gloeothece verrucosa]ADN17770.1 conserved hypothetical protein [Gloeothece verrucosa PCC 7822]